MAAITPGCAWDEEKQGAEAAESGCTVGGRWTGTPSLDWGLVDKV